MAAGNPDAPAWWVISVSTLNGQPWQAITFQGPRSAAQGAQRGGILAGPFATRAEAADWGRKWSGRTHRLFTDNPGASSGNPVTGLGSLGGSVLGNPLASLEAFYRVLTDGKLWRSLGWLLLGAWLVFTGISLWLRIPQRAAGVGAAAARAAI